MKRARNWAHTRPMIFTLTLTSLIDAFSILVIFLLMQSPSGAKDIALKSGEKLPTASTLTPTDSGVRVRIVHGQYIIDDQAVDSRDLVKALHALHQKGADSLILQADRTSDFDQVSPLVQAAAQTGFGKIKFAVLPKKANP